MPFFIDQIGKDGKLVRLSTGQGVGKSQQDFVDQIQMGTKFLKDNLIISINI